VRDDLRTIVDLGPVHMNGRIYDPLLGRFLSADTVVQAPGNLQSFNRYSYVLNNPLTLTDPTGFYFIEMLPSAVSQIVSGIMPAVAQADHAIDVGIEAHAVYQTVRSSGDGAATAGATSAAVAITRLTGAMDWAEAKMGEKIVVNNGQASTTEITSSTEVAVKALGGAAGMTLTGVGGAKSFTALTSNGSATAAAQTTTQEARAVAGTSAGDTRMASGAPKTGVTPEVKPGTAPAVEGAACFTAGTEIKTADGFVAIETVRVGDRVLTGSDATATEVDPQTWRLVRLRIKGVGDDVFEIECLRPLGWLQENSLKPGSRVHFAVSEMGIDGDAEVIDEAACPAIAKGPGRVVLMTVTHFNPTVLELTLAGSEKPLEPTAAHRLFSADRNDWVQAQELRLGERLRTANGTTEVVAITRKPGVHRVYNIEVETEHRYLVSALKVLSHNACNTTTPPQKPVSMEQALDLTESHVGPNNTVGTSGSGGTQVISSTVDANGNTITKIARIDINQKSSHVQKIGPHLNLETQINGKSIKTGPLKDPHLPIDPKTIRPGDS